MQLSGAYIGDTPLTEIRRGTTLVWSAGVEPPPPTPVAPENTVAPVFLDTTPDAGDVITSASFTLGTWTGTPPPDLSLVFKVNGVPTALPYTVQGGDVLSLTVTGTNEVDSVSVTATTAMATGAIALSLSRIVNAQSLFAPSLLPGGVTGTLQRLLNDTAIYAATLIAGMATLSPALLANATTVFAPALTQASGDVSPDSYNDYQPSPWAASQGMFCPFLLPGKDFDVGAGVIAASPTKAPLSGGQGITSDAEYFYINQTGWYQDYDFYGKRVVITFTCTDMDQVKFVNCRFNNAYITDSSYFGTDTSAGTILRTDCSFEYCSFDGLVTPGAGGSGECISNNKGLVGIYRCKFSYWVGDLVNIGGGYFVQNQVELDGNANAVHLDIVNWADTSIGSLYYARNYIDASVAVWPNSNGFNSLVKLVPTNGGAGPTHALLLEENFAWFSQAPNAEHTGNNAWFWMQNMGGTGEFRMLRNYLGRLRDDYVTIVISRLATMALQDNRKLWNGNSRWDDTTWDGYYNANTDQLETLPSVPSVTLAQTTSTTVTPTFPAPSGATRVEYQYRQIGSDRWLPKMGPAVATSGASVPNLGTDYEFQFRSVKVVSGKAYVSDWTQKLNTGVSGPVDVTASLARIDNVNTLYAPTMALASGDQSVAVSKLTNANTLYAPTLSLPTSGSTLTLARPAGGYTGNGTLSGGSLTWTSGSGYNRVYSSSKKTLGTGKHLIEVQFVTNPGDGDLQIGFADGANDAPTAWLGGTTAEIGVYQGDGFAYQNSDNAGRGLLTSGFAAGDWIQFALDLTGASPKLWMRKKTGATVSGWNEPIIAQGTQNPATGQGGATGFSAAMTDYYLCLQGSVAGDVFNVNFGASASQFAAVSGFSTWDTAAPAAQTATPALLTNTSTLYAPTLSTPAAVPVILVIGQSNAEGYGTENAAIPASLQSQTLGKVWRDVATGADAPAMAFAAYQPGINSEIMNRTPGTNTAAQKFGPEAGFAKAYLTANPGADLRIIRSTLGGSQLGSSATYGKANTGVPDQDWAPSSNELFLDTKNLIATVMAAITAEGKAGQIVAILDMQGESDAWLDTLSVDYFTNKQDFVTQVRAQWGSGCATAKWILGRITTNWPYTPPVRLAQAKIASQDSLITLVDTDSYPLAGDNIHYNGAGMATYGDDSYKSFAGTYGDTAPTFASSTASFTSVEQPGDGAAIGTVAVNNTPVPPVMYELTSGETAGFAIDPYTGAITCSDSTQLVYASDPTRTFVITAWNGAGSATCNVTVTLTEAAAVSDVQNRAIVLDPNDATKYTLSSTTYTQLVDALGNGRTMTNASGAKPTQITMPGKTVKGMNFAAQELISSVKVIAQDATDFYFRGLVRIPSGHGLTGVKNLWGLQSTTVELAYGLAFDYTNNKFAILYPTTFNGSGTITATLNETGTRSLDTTYDVELTRAGTTITLKVNGVDVSPTGYNSHRALILNAANTDGGKLSLGGNWEFSADAKFIMGKAWFATSVQATANSTFAGDDLAAWLV